MFYSEGEKKAVGNGWTDREAWEESGGDPEDWVSCKKFNERGDMIGSIRALEKRLGAQEKDFGSRLDGQKKLHDAQMKVTLANLEKERDAAIDLADREAANTIQGQIDEVKSQATETPAPASDQDALDSWNKDNPWIFGDTPKAAYAMMRFNTHTSGGKSPSEAIEAMQSELDREFPAKNERRETAPHVETNRSKPGGKAAVKLSWSQLTADEAKWFNVMPNAWKSKDDFLQAVIDERKSQ